MSGIARIAVAAVLILSAAGKLSDGFLSFSLTFARLAQVRSTVLAHGCAAAFAVLEVTASTIVLAGGKPIAAGVAAAAGLLFSAAGVVALARHQSIECACFGALTSKTRSMLGWQQVLVLPAWLLAAAGIYLGGKATPLARRALDGAGWLVVAVATVAIIWSIAKTARKSSRNRLMIDSWILPLQPIMRAPV